MRYEILMADPAGNKTAFVLTPVRAEERAGLAAKIMSIEELGAEQVGYLTEPGEGFDGRLEMAGGEFCGNASRALGMLLARQRARGEALRPAPDPEHLPPGAEAPDMSAAADTVPACDGSAGYAADTEKQRSGPQRFVLRVSGADAPVYVDADLKNGTASASMPLPKYVRAAAAGETAGVLVHLGGIAHFVVTDAEPSAALLERAETGIFSNIPGLEAFGIMFTFSGSDRMVPLVKVPAAGSLFWEGSCGSGSIAAAIAKTEGLADGDYQMDLVQPAGTIRAEISRSGGKVAEARIGGSVILGEPFPLEL